MRSARIVLSLLVGMLFSACTADVGTGAAELTLVDPDVMTSQQLYLATDVSSIPMTQEQLLELGIDEVDTIPVRVEIFDTVAVAWFAPDGEAQIGRDFIVALWPVEGRTPISGETRPGEDPGVTQPNGVIAAPGTSIETEASIAEPQLTLDDGITAVIMDFYDRVGTPEMWLLLQELQGAHPGCLE